MKLLLDTHTFLWFISGHASLSSTAQSLIDDKSNQPLLSIASLWEMAIKVSIGKLSLRQPFETLVPQQMALNGIKLLDIKVPHITAVSKLPFHHRDPFDRLLIAQASVEGISLISVDNAFDAYTINRVW